jgi:hypothetical protein
MEIVRANSLVCNNRLNVIKTALEKTAALDGCIAEIGTYKGGSAYFMAAHSPKSFYICDSFEGLPELTEQDIINTPRHRKGDFSDTTLEHVTKLLSPFPQAKVIKGFFPNPDIHSEMYDKKFSVVHLDVDLYQPTLDCLGFFYPRMVKGGIIISDDYTWVATPGVEKAFHEFLQGKPEKIIDSGFMSCYIIKE